MTTTKQIVILVGPPGSGKSTIAKTYEEGGFVRISQDDQGKVGHMELFDKALDNQQPIVIDRMGFSKDQRDRYLLPAKEAGYKSRIIVLHVPYEVCYERVMVRENHPTINDAVALLVAGCSVESTLEARYNKKEKSAKSALGTFFKNYERVQDDEADIVDRRGWENAYGKALVVDIDGTIANIDHRRHYVRPTEGKKKDWRSFNASMHLDTPNKWCVELVKAMMMWSSGATPEQGPYNLVFASGRGDGERKVTEDWLIKTLGFKQWQHLFMRRRDDSRKDDIVKEIILEFEIKPRFKQLLIVDDRKQVVDMWRSHGYTVLQCDEGNF